MQLVRIWTTQEYLCFSHVWGRGGVTIAQAEYYLHTCIPGRRPMQLTTITIGISSTIHLISVFFFLDRQFRGDVARKNLCWILSVNKENIITFLIWFTTSGYIWFSHVSFFFRLGRCYYCEILIANPIDGLWNWQQPK